MRTVGDWHSVRICRHSNRQTLLERGNLGRSWIFRSQDGATADHEKDCQHKNNIQCVFGERCSYSLLRKQVLYNESLSHFDWFLLMTKRSRY